MIMCVSSTGPEMSREFFLGIQLKPRATNSRVAELSRGVCGTQLPLRPQLELPIQLYPLRRYCKAEDRPIVGGGYMNGLCVGEIRGGMHPAQRDRDPNFQRFHEGFRGNLPL